MLSEAVFGPITSRAPTMKAALEVARPVASTKTPTLIVGEPGSGRATLAYAIHGVSKLKQIAAISCIGMGAADLRAALSGLVPRGDIGSMRGSSLILLEVDALSAESQTILTATLGSQRRFVRRQLLCDVPGPRLISTSRRDLRSLVQQGRFRADLCYRLAGAVIHLPPLCRRAEDIPFLAAEILRQEHSRHHAAAVSPAGMEVLCAYAWPGNLLQLRNVVLSAAAYEGRGLIGERSISRFLTAVTSGTEIDIRVGTSLEAAERQVILATLGACSGNRQRTADMLGISRRTLYQKLASYRAGDGSMGNRPSGQGCAAVEVGPADSADQGTG